MGGQIMKPLNRLARVGAVALALSAFAASAPAVARINQVDGNVWRASSLDEKRAYIVGVANTVDVHHELQIRRGTLDPEAPLNRVFDVFDQGTIDNAIERIDNWYGADPARLDTPVLGVVWLGLVEAMKAAGQ
jgi:hypothetical protein